MVETLWLPSFELALHRNRGTPTGRLVQLATVRKDGRPSVRTVVLRGFLAETHRPHFASDTRTVKVEEIREHPWVEACCYFPQTREQFRLGGLVTVASSESRDPGLVKARNEVWSEMSDESRLAYTWPDPGRPRHHAVPFSTTPPDPHNPMPHFCLLVLDVREVDHLELSGNPQHRWRYHCDDRGRWSGLEINP
jgi:PPOX class probable FMN-dependent enzyme